HRFVGRARVATSNDVFLTSAQVFRDRTVSRLQCASAPSRDGGGRGRIRTSVARKERPIYSLLVLATHPPVQQEHRDLRRWSPSGNFATQKGLVSKDTSPFIFQCEEFTRAKPKIPILKNSAGGGNLTPDPLITNQMLYQLSYASTPNPANLSRGQSNCKGVPGASTARAKLVLELPAKHQLYTIPAETYTEKVAAHGRMKRTVIVILAACIAAAAVLAYVYHAHEKASQLRAEDAQFSVQPGSVAANSSGGASTSANSTDLVHQLPAGASAVVFVDVAALRRSSFANELAALAPTSAQDPDYTEFVRATGFDYSRDLDQVAVALWPQNSPTSVFALAKGRFNQTKIKRYALRNGHRIKFPFMDIYEVREENSPRTIRLTFLPPDEIALADGPAIPQLFISQVAVRLDPEMS